MDSARNLAERPCGTLALLLSRPWKSVQKGGDPPLSWRRTVARPPMTRCAINGLPEPPVPGEGGRTEVRRRSRHVRHLRAGTWSAEVQFVFGDCVLDADRRELTRGSEVVSVGP